MFDEDKKNSDSAKELAVSKPKRVRFRISADDMEVKPKRTNKQADIDPKYKVGYKKPPLHMRFQKGQSGNPSGKRKRDAGVDVRALVQDVFLDEVRVRVKGKKPEWLPSIVALIKKRHGDAAKDDRAFREIMRIGERFGVFNIVRKPKRDVSWMTPEQREASMQAFLLLRKAGLTKED